jgi:hypothetical protein
MMVGVQPVWRHAWHEGTVVDVVAALLVLPMGCISATRVSTAMSSLMVMTVPGTARPFTFSL